MARLPLVRVPALAELANTLSRSPRRRLLEQIARAESLASEVDPETKYSTEFLTFRLTGYRGESEATEVVSGEALLADLSALVERLCVAAKLQPDDLPDGSIPFDELAEKWSVSRKTIERFRRKGLVARRLALAGRAKGSRLVFTPGAVDAFRSRAGDAIERAAGFTQLDVSDRAVVLRRAARYRTRFGCSLSAAAARLAVRFGRSHEGVRQLLLSHDEAERAKPNGRPIFPGPRARDRATRFALLRDVRDGAEPADLGALVGSDARSAQRMLVGLRLDLARRLRFDAPASPMFARPEAAAVLLEPDVVRIGLSAPPVSMPLDEQIETLRRARPGPPEPERSRATAHAFLLWRSNQALGAVKGRSVAVSTLDTIETDLRWAWLLRAALLTDQMSGVVRTLEEVVGPLERLGTTRAFKALHLAADAASRAIMNFQAWRGGRLTAAVTLAVSRSTPRSPSGEPSPQGRAARRVSASAVGLDPTAASSSPALAALLGVDPSVWDAWHTQPDRFSPEAHAALGRRMGWDASGPPLDLDALAKLLGTTRMWAARRVREGIRAGRDVGRGVGRRADSMGP